MGLIGKFIWRVLDEFHHLSCVSTAKSSNAVTKLGFAAMNICGCKLIFCLSKPNTCVASPKFWKFEDYSLHTVSI